MAREAGHDLSKHNRRMSGYDELTDEKMSALGRGRREDVK